MTTPSAAGSNKVQQIVSRLRRRAPSALDTDPVPAKATSSKAFLDGDQLDNIRAETIQWLWRDHIPLGALTYLDGMPGVGKTTVGLDLAARVSTGAQMPDGSSSDLEGPRGVLIAEGEDSVGATIRPRLEAASADLSQFFAVSELVGGRRGPGTKVPWSIPEHLSELEEAIIKRKAALLIIDPFISFLSESVRFTVDQDVRRAMDPLADIAQRQGCAILILRHLTKSGGSNAVHRGAGSTAISASCRSGLLVTSLPSQPGSNRQILSRSKGNLSARPPAIEYTIDSVPEFDSSIIRWGETRNLTADELLAQQSDADDVSAREQIAELLLELTAEGPIEKPAARDNLRDAGLFTNDKAVQRAAKAAGIASLRSHTCPPVHYWAREGQCLDSPDTGSKGDSDVPTGATGLTRENADSDLSPDTEPEVSGLGEPILETNNERARP